MQPMSNDYERRKAEQQAWVRAILSEHRLNMAELARKIGRSPTTIQRPMNDPNYTGMFSGRVLSEIADFAGLGIMEFPNRPKGLSENEAAPYIYDSKEITPFQQATAALINNQPGRVAWRITTSMLDMEGVKPGDVLIVDLNRKPRTDDIVCAQFYSPARDRADTIFRKYAAPYLITSSTTGTTKPVLVDDDAVKIMGVSIALLRE